MADRTAACERLPFAEGFLKYAPAPQQAAECLRRDARFDGVVGTPWVSWGIFGNTAVRLSTCHDISFEGEIFMTLFDMSMKHRIHSHFFWCEWMCPTVGDCTGGILGYCWAWNQNNSDMGYMGSDQIWCCNFLTFSSFSPSFFEALIYIWKCP